MPEDLEEMNHMDQDKTEDAHGVEVFLETECQGGACHQVTSDTTIRLDLEAHQRDGYIQICAQDITAHIITIHLTKSFAKNATKIRTTLLIAPISKITTTKNAQIATKVITQPQNVDKKMDFSISHRQTSCSLPRQIIYEGL